MSITLSLTPAQAEGLLVLAEAADPELCFPERRRRRAVLRALDRLRDALDGHAPDRIELELHALADAVEQVRDPVLLAALGARLRHLVDLTRRWTTIERLHRRATFEGDEPLRSRCEALLEAPRVDDPSWRAEVTALVEAHDGLAKPPPAPR